MKLRTGYYFTLSTSLTEKHFIIKGWSIKQRNNGIE